MPALQPSMRRPVEQFVDSQAVPNDTVPTTVLNSWARTSKFGLRPTDSVIATSTPGRYDAKRILEQHRYLVDIARLPIEELHKSLPSSPDWVVLCISADGMIAHGIGCQPGAPKILQAALQLGRSVREADIGTSAAGCALAERSCQTVVGNEHYLHELTSLVCAAVPLHSPDGTVAGVLDLTRVGAELDVWAVDMLRWTARKIENDMMRNLSGRTIICLNPDPHLAGTALEGLIALDESTQTCLLNARARYFLGLETHSHEAVPAERLFESAEWKRLLLNPGATNQTRSVRDTRGFLLYASQSPAPITKLAASTGSVPRERRDLRLIDGTGLPLDKDPKIAEVLKTGIRAVDKGVPLILEGESGTGKEVMAKAIHLGSARADKPLVAINCAAIPEGLIETELFGYVDGAFTGGRRGGSAGKIAQADGGTLFLDEIGDMPLVLQTRLLRVLQERQITPVGGLHPIPVEFALICATHRNLSQSVEQGKFRNDLFYRINGLLLRLPPLRERHDLKDLVQRFLLECSEGNGALELEDDVFALFASYSWPGNIRQLRNAICASAVLAGDRARISTADLPEILKRELNLSGDANDAQVIDKPLAIAESETIRRVLESANGNVTRAARVLGISRSTLHKRLRALSLRY